MDKELITTNEAHNDGRSTLIYPYRDAEMWIAYGYSAYNLAHLDGANCLSGFSTEIQLPYTCITNTDFKHLVATNMKIVEVKDGYYQLPMNSKVEPDVYRNWVSSIK